VSILSGGKGEIAKLEAERFKGLPNCEVKRPKGESYDEALRAWNGKEPSITKGGRFRILESLASATNALVGFFAVKFVAILLVALFPTSSERAAACARPSIIG
jgi:hypothetical protein